MRVVMFGFLCLVYFTWYWSSRADVASGQTSFFLKGEQHSIFSRAICNCVCVFSIYFWTLGFTHSQTVFSPKLHHLPTHIWFVICGWTLRSFPYSKWTWGYRCLFLILIWCPYVIYPDVGLPHLTIDLLSASQGTTVQFALIHIPTNSRHFFKIHPLRLLLLSQVSASLSLSLLLSNVERLPWPTTLDMCLSVFRLNTGIFGQRGESLYFWAFVSHLATEIFMVPVNKHLHVFCVVITPSQKYITGPSPAVTLFRPLHCEVSYKDPAQVEIDFSQENFPELKMQILRGILGKLTGQFKRERIRPF